MLVEERTQCRPVGGHIMQDRRDTWIVRTNLWFDEREPVLVDLVIQCQILSCGVGDDGLTRHAQEISDAEPLVPGLVMTVQEKDQLWERMVKALAVIEYAVEKGHRCQCTTLVEHRDLAACEQLIWQRICATVVDDDGEVGVGGQEIARPAVVFLVVRGHNGHGRWPGVRHHTTMQPLLPPRHPTLVTGFHSIYIIIRHR